MDVKTTCSRLEIFTLGQFLVRRGGKVLSDENCRSSRLWELFKYIITHRGHSIPPEVILETLWSKQEYTDPRRASRTLVHRLRQLLDGDFPEKGASYIKFSHSCYNWNTSLDYWVDVDEFENLCRQAESAKDTIEAIAFYRKAISLYKGDYLPESAYQEWVLPIRSYYRRIYLQSLFKLIGLLRQEKRHDEIIKVCEKAFQVELFEEDLHIFFMDALLAEDKTKQALSHYEYITGVFYRELGVKPSPAMKNVYRQIISDKTGIELDLSDIQDGMCETEETGGAFFCDPVVFRSLYNLERRRGERTGKAVFLSLLTLSGPGQAVLPPGVLQDAGKKISGILKDSLRQGDAVTRWNDAQFIMLLQGLTQEQAETVLLRLTGNFEKPGVILHGKLQPLLPPAPYSEE
jgi:DNA-binding SARP family transcriptional activator